MHSFTGQPFPCVWKPLGAENAAVAKQPFQQEAVCPVEETNLLQSTTKACEMFLERRKGHWWLGLTVDVTQPSTTWEESQ